VPINKVKPLEDILKEKLKPIVRQIDEHAVYPIEVLQAIGEAGYLSSTGKTLKETAAGEIDVVKQVSKYCMTTGFNLWCHLAALTYLRHTSNEELRKRLLPKLESGEVLGGTGLSNPMKYYAGLEKLHLKTTKTTGGYIISGVLPAVSNLGKNHWFGVIAETEDDQRVMALVSCEQEGLSLKEKVSYLGLNGSATYTCCFEDVFIADDQILSENADDFVKQIRPYFVAYQIPLGIGVTYEAINSMEKHQNKQNGCNQFLPVQPEDLRKKLDPIEQDVKKIFGESTAEVTWEALLPIRKDVAYLTLEAVNAAMLHAGGSAYLKNSADARRVRETYFFMNLTPTVKHLGKMINR
jgi:hypothetical protein